MYMNDGNGINKPTASTGTPMDKLHGGAKRILDEVIGCLVNKNGIKKIRDVDESCWIKVPNTHEAIISQRMFDIVQEVLKLDTCASKGQKIVHLFSGIVRCGDCGQNMVRCTVSKKGKKYILIARMLKTQVQHLTK